ncbi:hypothetical protein [Rhizobium oryzicola]|uniref:Uncharacterized protein n=1 Tax=Rhizobium oryzicola TaxID=1232668 RepID=A0ABT8SXX2_9HYPH|nr:hypothetical protein [Rhizobium oryzicola]MDO1583196.1 hypothetical protein [Rhizobium oryzicola]
MTDLAEMLVGTHGREVAAKIMARFEEADQHLLRKMQAGVTPADYATMAAVREALRHGSKVLRIAERAATVGLHDAPPARGSDLQSGIR